ncbi:MAG: radical SAM protein [Planctomycetota bacterium]|jgi:radical SAM protein with 4Fe4S-binding SPASM domain
METIDRSIRKTLKKAPQYTRLKRHVMTLLYHSTPRKLINLAAVEFQRRIRRISVFGYPYYLIIDTGNVCNLRCPLCPTGTREKNMNRQLLKFDLFTKIIDRLYPYVYEVALHNWGEPFLNSDICKMITYCRQKNIGTNLSTNLNIPDLDVEAIIKSGLEYLVVSLDGTTQDTYSFYRIGGNIDIVFRNIKHIITAKRNLRTKKPFIEWQYIVMKHNCHQIDDARKIAKELGVDLIRFIAVGLPFGTQNARELAEKWFPYIPDEQDGYIEGRFLQQPIRGPCFYLYRSVTINPDGTLAPCCAVWESRHSFGDLAHADFSEIWNNDSYQSARALFSRKETSTKTVCSRCNLFYRRPIRHA